MKPKLILTWPYETDETFHPLTDRDISVSITTDQAFDFQDKSEFKVFWQCEPPCYINVIPKLLQYASFYDLILTWNPEVLKRCSNAVFFPFAYVSWPTTWKAPYLFPKKKFGVSFLTSTKCFLPGHYIRQHIFENLPESIGDLKICKYRPEPPISTREKGTLLDSCQFSICNENDLLENWFTNHIVDVMATKAVPIYWGGPSLDQHFNMNGVIRFENYEELLSELKQITPDTWSSMEEAVEDNYNRAMAMADRWGRVDAEITKALERSVLDKKDWRDKEFYPSKLPCCVCGTTEKTGSEPRFGYVVCEKDSKLSPGEINELDRQARRKTR